MNKFASATVLSLLLSTASVAADKRISASVSSIEDRSRTELGVSLHALSLMSRVTPNSFFPKEALVRNDELARFQELESAGYLEISEVRGLPDGTQPQSVFVALRLTARGQELRDALIGR